MIDKFCMDVVHGCQLRCVGCPNSTLKPSVYHIDPDFYDKCLKNVDTDYIRVFRTFVFGEPLLHPNITAVLEKIPQQKFKTKCVELSTNGQRVDQIEDVVRQKVVTRIVVSCDGVATRESYEEMRPPAKWDTLMEFLNILSESVRKYNPNLALVVRSICDRSDGMKKWKKMLIPMGYRPSFRKMRKDPDSRFAKGKKIKRILGPCECLRNKRFYVDADGTVIPCCAHPRAGILGDLSKEKYSVINSTTRKAFRESLHERHKVPICNRCELK